MTPMHKSVRGTSERLRTSSAPRNWFGIEAEKTQHQESQPPACTPGCWEEDPRNALKVAGSVLFLGATDFLRLVGLE